VAFRGKRSWRSALTSEGCAVAAGDGVVAELSVEAVGFGVAFEDVVAASALEAFDVSVGADVVVSPASPSLTVLSSESVTAAAR